jgi:succinyl-diaminopimelate desuccinylase
MSPTLDLTLDLIRRASISPQDAGCQSVMAARLAAAGFAVTPLPFGPVENFWATRGPADAPTLCFAGHTDVVPTGPLEAWTTPPFEPLIRDGVLYGRGAADMKSALAAMVTATESFVARRPDHRIRLAYLITSDEEGPSIEGTKKVVEHLMSVGEQITWCVIGEPTSDRVLGDTVKIGRRGSMSGILTVHGIQGHIAYPHLADNPIHRFAPALAELCSHHWDDGNAHFQPTSFQVATIQAGTGVNVIPGELNVRFNFRFCPLQTVDSLQSATRDILDRHGIRYTLEWKISGLPFYTPPGLLSQAVTQAIETVTGITPELSTSGGTSDGRFIAPMGAEVVEIGVVNASIHKIDEHVIVNDVDKLARIYDQLIDQLDAG